MLVFIAIVVLLTLCYGILMLLYRNGWHKQPVFTVPDSFVPATSITVIIPARNEALHIGNCIRSVLQQNYPAHLFEILVVDDHSTDGTTAIAESFEGNITCIRLVEHLDDEKTVAYKKKALSTAIAMSRGALIVTTDADCIVRPDWLKTIAAFYEKDEPVMIAAPVDFMTDDKLVSIFQSIDFMSMQGITAAVHHLRMGNMCNGANLAFNRLAYHEVKGYAGIDNLASGDDFLLMTKMQQRFPGRIGYLKSSSVIVYTLPQPDWGHFLNQRIRWASKSGKYNDKKLTAVLAIVYLYNLVLLLSLIIGLFVPDVLLVFCGSFIVKILAELYFIHPLAGFFNKRQQLFIFPFMQPLHILYIVVAGFLGFVGVYKWKGRVVR